MSESIPPENQVISIDVRGLPPPEPMEHCLEALADLPPGASLQMLIDREPHPLYGILDRDGFAHECAFIGPHYLLTIRRA